MTSQKKSSENDHSRKKKSRKSTNKNTMFLNGSLRLAFISQGKQNFDCKIVNIFLFDICLLYSKQTILLSTHNICFG